jgi:hypothetical protein
VSEIDFNCHRPVVAATIAYNETKLNMFSYFFVCDFSESRADPELDGVCQLTSSYQLDQAHSTTTTNSDNLGASSSNDVTKDGATNAAMSDSEGLRRQ